MILMIDTILTLTSHIIAAVTLAPLKYSKRKTYTIWAIWGLLLVALACFGPSPQESGGILGFAVFSLTCILHVAVYFLTTTGRLCERFFLILSYATFFTACCGVTQFLKAFLLPDGEWQYLIAYAITLVLLLYVFLCKLLPTFKQSAGYIERGWALLSSLMAVFFFALIAWFVFPNNINDYTLGQAIGLPILVVILFVTYAVIFVCIRNIADAQRARQMSLQMELLSAQVSAQSQASEEARRNRHDLRHHNAAMLALAEKGELSELIQYLKGFGDNDTKGNDTVWCENATLNSILCIYAAKAAEQKISTDILAEAEQELPISPTDLVAIVANLFENAIHGAAKSGAAMPTIHIRIFRKSKKLLIRMENTCAAKLRFPEAMPEEQYGVGIYSILKAAESYAGECAFTADGGIFTTLIMLNLSK